MTITLICTFTKIRRLNLHIFKTLTFVDKQTLTFEYIQNTYYNDDWCYKFPAYLPPY